jgi:hypothetical protein
VEITDDMLRQWATLGRAGIKAAGGIGGLAGQNNVSAAALKNYLRADGTLTGQGKDRLDRSGKVELTDDMLRQWAALGKAGIKAAGGLEGLASQNNVSGGALKNCLRADGTLTPYGESRLNPEGKVGITVAMLRQWAALGKAGIEAAGGIDGLAKEHNVSIAALRSYLRIDGSLTQRGEDRLNPGGKVDVTDDMLRQWATLGPSGIRALGGFDGLARHYNVTIGAMRNYLRADGSLRPLGEERLRRAGTPPA